MERLIDHIRRAAWALVLAIGVTPQASAQEPEPERGWQIAGVPGISFDSDEGFHYGAIVEAYHYGDDGEYRPYLLTLQSTILFSTEGKRDLIFFFDTPHALPGGSRLTMYLALERHTATPYYGLGNASDHDEELEDEDGPNPHFYRFGRDRNQLTFDLQTPLGEAPVRLLFGGGVANVRIDPTPQGKGTSFLATEFDALGRGLPGGWTNFLRVGLVWDTRDREVGPRSGVWSDVLVKRAAETLAGDHDFTRWTITDRRYFSLTDRLVFANRVLLQGTHGDAPFYELQIVETSFRAQEGLGGSKSLRGIPKNRYAGKGMLLWNAELRFHAGDLTVLGRTFQIVASGFVDSGRVWERGVRLGDAFSDLKHGYGAGLRAGMGDSFVVALDVGHSVEAAAPVYIGLGYLY